MRWAHPTTLDERQEIAGKPMRIAVLMPNWIGDAVMATAALHALRQHFRGAFILGVMKSVIAELLAGTSFFDDRVFYEPGALQESHRFWSAVRRVRQLRPDMIFCFTNSLRAGLFCWLSGAAARIGWRGGVRRWLFMPTELPIQRGTPAKPLSALDYYLSIVRAAGVAVKDRRMHLATRPRDEVAADETFRRLGLVTTRPLLVLNAGSAYGPAKSWPSEHCAQFARRWADSFDSNVLVLCGPTERQAAAAIEAQANHSRVRSLAAFEPDLGRNKAIIRRARLMISTDSGPRHIAAAFGVPLVALFGPTDPRWSENYHTHEVKLRLGLPCQPCARRRCPLGHHRCMRELTTEQVWPAAVRLWSTLRAAADAS